MKRFNYLILLFAIGCIAGSCKMQQPAYEHASDLFLADLNTLINRNEDFLGQCRTSDDQTELQEEFLKLRLQYKKTEAFAEYFTPSTVKLVNGAPLDEVEDEENAVFEPGGLQVIEELIYAEDSIHHEELIRHVRKMHVNLKRIKMLWADIQISDSHVMDALKMELFRLITLGISGFDTPGSGNAIAESKVVLSSLGGYLAFYDAQLPQYDSLKKQLDSAIVFLDKAKDFNSFDRAGFISEHINPICRTLHQNQQLAKIPFIDDRKLLQNNVATLFDKGAFDSQALVSNPRLKSSRERVALGEKLFYDTRLSGNAQTSCGSCHNPALAYTDGLATSRGFASKHISRNAPTIMYAALQQSMFYDLRAPSLEDQALDVIHNTDEMRGSIEDITAMIAADNTYKALFKTAYPEIKEVEPVYVQNALAVFVRSLSPFNAPFDRYMRGDKRALTDDQKEGFNVFMGKARCGTCHFVPLFNGTVPPDYQRTESEVLGVTTNANFKQPVLDTDRGRGAFNKFPQWQHAFKTSTLRNIAKTAPYMHNGAYTTLEQVMDFYNEGGGAGLGLNVENQTLAPDKLKLTPVEIKQVIAFLGSLSDDN